MPTEDKTSIILRLMGLQPKDIPVNCYSWFGLQDFEDNPETINAAYEKLMAQLQRIISSSNYEPSVEEKEVARHLCKYSFEMRQLLLNPTKKAQYDADIRRERTYFNHVRNIASSREPVSTSKQAVAKPSESVTIKTAAPEKTIPAPPVVQTFKTIKATQASKKLEKAKRRKQQLKMQISLIIAGAIAGILLALLLIRILEL